MITLQVFHLILMKSNVSIPL